MPSNSWEIKDLFPDCSTPDCSLFGTSHLLTHQKELFDAKENYIYWQGGVGSAKTVAHGVLAAVHAIMIPENEIILFRRDLGLNYKTLWKEFKSAIRQACNKGILSGDYNSFWSVKKAGDYTVCTLPNGSKAYCGQTKNWSEYMGPSYGFIGIDDAMENTHEFFRGEGTVGGMQSRLRNPKAAYFRMPKGSTIDMRRFILTSNPPPYDHWLWRVFGKTPGVRKLEGTNINYRFILTSTDQNTHLPPTYIEEIASQHDKEDLARILQGKSVSYYPGVRIYKKFKPERHVGEFKYNPDIPLLVSLDPGYQHPAAIICQAPLCAYGNEHFIALSEVSNLYDVNTWEFMELQDEENNGKLGLLPHIYTYYPDCFDFRQYLRTKNKLEQSSTGIYYKNRDELTDFFRNIAFCCDRAADKSGDASKDKRSVRKIWRDDFGISTRRRFLGLAKSLNQVDKLFDEKCPCGNFKLLINTDCEMLIEGYKGGYRFRKLRDGSHSEKPLEDHKFEDVADAHRYGIENFYFAYRNSEEIKETAQALKEDYLVLPETKWDDLFK